MSQPLVQQVTPVMPHPAQLTWRVAIAIAVATCALTFASRILSPAGAEHVSLYWPAGGIMLAGWILFGLPGALCSAVGLAAWAVIEFPSRPAIWVVQVTIELIATAAGYGTLRMLIDALRRRTVGVVFPRAEWLYCLSVATIAVAALLAGMITASTRSLTGLYTGYAWFEVALAYWIVQSLGYVIFTPLMLALFATTGYGRASLPFSSQPFDLRTSIDWLTVILALLLAAVIGLLVFNGFAGHARVLLLWCFALMAWCALHRPALPTYITLAVTVASILPLRSVAIEHNHDADQIPFETFEGILMAVIGVLVAQVIQAIMHQNVEQQRVLERRLRTDTQSGLLNEAGLREAIARRGAEINTAVAVFYFPALPQLFAGLGAERAHRVQTTLAERVSLFGEDATRLDPTTYCCVWPQLDAAGLQEAIQRTEEQLAGLRIRAGEGTLRLQYQMGVLLLDAPPANASAELPNAAIAALWQLEGALQSSNQSTIVVKISDQLNLAARERSERSILIRQALELGQFELYAQPIESNLAPRQADTPLMCEVLARLRLEDGTILPPSAFLPICEQHGLIRQLDRTMVQKTFSWFAARPDALARLSRCSINLSGQSISANGIAAEIRSLATNLNLPVGKFSFEITESEAIQDASAAVRAVAELRAAGFGTAIDDFGTGLATFSYLKRFEVDLIKIDGAFIRVLDDGVRRADVDREIVRSIVRVAQSLGVKTAAEFVETQAIREHVTALGVHYSQGYAIGKPMPIAEMFS
jgi:EAL domain-containing protein (putative c-di-GMP-specific phosphodiesterase class I)